MNKQKAVHTRHASSSGPRLARKRSRTQAHARKCTRTRAYANLHMCMHADTPTRALRVCAPALKKFLQNDGHAFPVKHV